MANKKISELSAAATLTGAELIEIVQSSANVKTTLAAIKNSPGSTANVKHYGAVGDGVTDDSTAFTNAIASGLPVEVPKGNYLVSAEFTLNNGQCIFGYGRDSNIVTATNGSTTDLTVAYHILQLVDNCLVQDLRFTGNGKVTFAAPWTSQNGIWIRGSHNNIRNVEFNGLRGTGVLGVHPSLS